MEYFVVLWNAIWKNFEETYEHVEVNWTMTNPTQPLVVVINLCTDVSSYFNPNIHDE